MTSKQSASALPSHRGDSSAAGAHAQGAAAPRIYLHGLGLDNQMWGHGPREGELMPNFPGFGDTPFAGPMSLDDLADHVASLLGEPTHVVGFSLGSYVAQHLAIRHPRLVRSLVLACGGAVDTSAGSRERARTLREAGGAGFVPDSLDRWFSPEVLATPGHPAVEYASMCLRNVPAEVLASYWETLAGHDVREQLGSIRVPTTVIAATNDRSVAVVNLHGLANGIADARFARIPGSHLLPLEDPTGFASLVESHLRWVRI